MAISSEKDIIERLINNDSLFNKMFVFHQDFDILPDDKKHYGASIAYQDLSELKDDFINELYDTIVDWVYGSEKYNELKEAAIKKGKSESSANSEIQRKARGKFRKSENGEELLIQGQLGELLLFHFIQRFFHAAPLLRKMKITTSKKHERFGADAIHFKFEDYKPIVVLGEAKTYTSKYHFKLTKDQVAAIILKLDELSVPKDICYKNRYWDPFILDVIYTKYPESVPAHPLERGAKAKLDRMLKFLRDTPETKMMYEKHIPREYRENIGRGILKDLCMTWAKETSLSEILSNINGSEDEIADKIEDVIEVLQNTISYRVPLLLKPIFDIKNPESVFLPCMQSGAYNKVTKLLIEIGVPRECAIYLNNGLFSSYVSGNKTDAEIECDIRRMLKENIGSLPYWIGVQLEFLG